MRQWGKDTRVIEHRNKTAPKTSSFAAKTKHIVYTKNQLNIAINLFPQPRRVVRVRAGRSFERIYTLHARNSFIQSIHSSYATIMIETTKFIANGVAFVLPFFLLLFKLKLHTKHYERETDNCGCCWCCCCYRCIILKIPHAKIPKIVSVFVSI